MAVKTKDVLIEKGMAGIELTVKHPITGEETTSEQFYEAANYPATGPGMRSLYNELTGEGRKLHSAHGEKSPDDVIVELFEARCKEKGGAEFILRQLKSASDEAKAALRKAKVAGWREKLAELDVQVAAKDAYAKIEAAKAALEKAKADAAKLKADTAKKLDIDPTFDVGLTKDGFYIPSEVKPKSGGTRTTKKRNWEALIHYTQSGSINDVEYKAEADVENQDEDNPKRGDWTVVYTAKGKKYEGKGKTLNAANMAARKLMIDAVAPGFKANQNAPEAYSVPMK